MQSLDTLLASTPLDTSAATRLQASGAPKPGPDEVAQARDVHDAFTSFVGETFFAQMIKAMRSSQDKAAYFHGGRAEEVFRSQLDQTLAEQMTQSNGAQISEGLFRNQFPHLAEVLQAADQAGSLQDLEQLVRR